MEANPPRNPARLTPRRIALRLVFGLLVAALGLVGINGLAFLGEYLAYGATYENGQPKGLYTYESGRPRLKPGAELNGWLYQLSINDMGFRGPEPAATKPANALRVWCMGGSTTFDIYASTDAHTWPAVLQDELTRALPARTVEVINAGVPGEVLAGNGQDLARWTRSLDIDYGIYYLGPNDLRRQLGHANIPLGQGTRADLALFRVLVRALDAPPRILESWAGRRLEAGQLASMRNDLDRVLTATGMLGVRPILATHALRADPGSTGEVAHRQVGEASALLALTPEATLAAFHDYNDMIRVVSEARNLPMADIRAAVPSDPANWGDATHFRDPGSRLAAQAFAATILADLAR